MLAPWKKSYDKHSQHIKKQRHYFADKGPSSQSYGFFAVVMYGCESWTIKKAECQRIDTFELWCWRKLLRVPWTAGEIQPVHPKGDQPWDFFGRNDAKAETPVLWPPHVKRPWCWEGLGTGGEGDNRGWDGWMASLTLCTWVWVNSRSWW